ncbi:MAG: M56 family metallopeptidase [Proteobacteria bacterium]|nr:M56 family metallopeptidase [Pseudomonadota bacterium]
MTVLEAGASAKAAIHALAMVGLQGTILAVVALAITRAGRLRPAWQAAVWLVVLAKFALPWGPALPFSLSDLLAALRGDAVAAPFAPSADVPFVAATSSIAPALGWLALAGLWILGSSYFAARAIAASLRARRQALAAPPASADVVALVGELAARIRVTAPRVVIGDGAVGPHVIGVRRPIIVIPASLVGDLVGDLLRATLLHELAHVRRRDAIARVVQLVATAVFFFWPVVRLANRRLDLAREAACDAWALEAGDLPRPAYARLLVQMARLARGSEPSLALAASRPSALQARVDAVLAARARRGFGPIHALGLLAWIALSLGGARSAAARGEPVCQYSSHMAEVLRALHPEADLDGDGVLSRGEACEFQAELRRRVTEPSTGELVSRLAVEEQDLLAEPLCCNCESFQGQPSPLTVDPSCQQGTVTP